MKTALRLPIFLVLFLITLTSFGQDQQDYHIKTVFHNSGPRASGGYGAITNKFTRINGEFANLAELYGGWYVNHRFLIGVGFAAVTNNIPVPFEQRIDPALNTSYEYGQLGLMTEYVIGSDKAVHLAFQLFGGAGFTVQYERYSSGNYNNWDDHHSEAYDENWFYIAEPGVKVEVNIFRWMRFCPGVSYRAAFESNSLDLTDDALSGASVNVSLKFGKF
jgi:hypothetical protein